MPWYATDHAALANWVLADGAQDFSYVAGMACDGKVGSDVVSGKETLDGMQADTKLCVQALVENRIFGIVRDFYEVRAAAASPLLRAGHPLPPGWSAPLRRSLVPLDRSFTPARSSSSSTRCTSCSAT